MAKLGLVSDEQFQKELANSNTDKGNTIRENSIPNRDKSPAGTSIGPEPEPKKASAHIIDSEVLPAEVNSIPKRGRSIGGVAVPDNIRKLIAEEAVLNGRQSAIELAKGFGISESSVSAYTAGATSTASYKKPDENLTNYLNARKTRRAKQALKVLGSSLNILTPEKLEGVKARDLAGIAKDMASVVKSMEPENTNVGADNNAPKFIVYAPQIRNEQSFEFVISQD